MGKIFVFFLIVSFFFPLRFIFYIFSYNYMIFCFSIFLYKYMKKNIFFYAVFEDFLKEFVHFFLELFLGYIKLATLRAKTKFSVHLVRSLSVSCPILNHFREKKLSLLFFILFYFLFFDRFSLMKE